MNTDIKNKIIKYVDLLFDEVPYSSEIFNAKEKIIKELTIKYNDEKSIEKIINKYNSLTKLALLAGYTKEDVDRWKSKETIVSFDNIKSEFQKVRRECYFKIILIIFTLVCLYNTIISYNQVYLSMSIIFFIGTIFYFLVRRRKKKKETYSIDSYTYLTSLHDKYGKKLLNSLFLTFSIIGFLVLFLLHLRANSKPIEIIEYINNNLLYLEIGILILFKNILIHRWIDNKIKNKKTESYYKQLFKISFISTIYYSIVILICYFIGKNMISLFLVFAAIYLFFAFIYNISKRKQIMYKNIVLSKLKIALYILALLVFSLYQFMQRDVWLIQPYINSIKNVYNGDDIIKYDDDTGIYTITNPSGDFKILQLTDIHLGGSIISYDKDLKALDAVYKLIKYTKPDLVIVTGDLTFPMGIMSFSLNNYTPVMQFASFMRNTGVPWAFTYGNHDTETIATNSKEDLNSLYMSLSYKTSKNLLYPYIQPNVTGRNNQIIEIRNKNGSLNQALFLIDSNAYTGEGLNKYDYIHDDQVDWYEKEIKRLTKEENKKISSLVFFHIPLQEYKTAYELYESGSNKVRYYFGFNEEELYNNKVGSSNYPSKMFDTAVRLKSTKGFFCGHDHYNNMSLEYQGIRLTYGMSIDYLAMPGISNRERQRGATLITTHKDSSIDIKQIPLTSIE